MRRKIPLIASRLIGVLALVQAALPSFGAEPRHGHAVVHHAAVAHAGVPHAGVLHARGPRHGHALELPHAVAVVPFDAEDRRRRFRRA